MGIKTITVLVVIVILMSMGSVLILTSRDEVVQVTTATSTVTATSAVATTSTVTATSKENVTEPPGERSKPDKLEKITLRVPFDPKNPVQGMMPMGETIEHPDEGELTGGHPGIDLQWYNHPDGRPKIYASAAGEIFLVEQGDEDGTFAVTILHDDLRVALDTGERGYYTAYGPIDPLDFEFKVGDRIEAGGFLGYVYQYPVEELPLNVYMIHWEFGILETWISKVRPPPEGWVYKNRLCPMTYFDEESRELLEDIWSRPDSYEHKDQFPNICNNIYHGKDE